MVGPFIELPEPMKLSISTKLFIAVMASVLFVILSMGVANGWSFGNGFLDYLNEQALLRMKPVLPAWRAPTSAKATGNSCATSPIAGSNCYARNRAKTPPSQGALPCRCPT